MYDQQVGDELSDIDENEGSLLQIILLLLLSLLERSYYHLKAMKRGVFGLMVRDETRKMISESTKRRIWAVRWWRVKRRTRERRLSREEHV